MNNKIKIDNKTDYPGVIFRINSKNQKIYYIRYKRPGERKVIEDKLSGNGWTASRANNERSKRMNNLSLFEFLNE